MTASFCNHQKRFYSYLPVSMHSYHTMLTYLGCRLDAGADVNVMHISVYKGLSHDYSLTELGLVQGNLKVYNTTSMNVIGSCVLHHQHISQHKP